MISEPELQELWRVSRSATTAWRSGGLLTPAGRGGRNNTTHLYYPHTIDALHRTWLHKSNAALQSALDLLDEQGKTELPILLTREETQQQLKISKHAFTKKIDAGDIVGLQLPGTHEWRVPAQSVTAYIATLYPEAVTVEKAAHILGLPVEHVVSLLKTSSPVLDAAHILHETTAKFVTAKSLLAFLAANLARDGKEKLFVTPDEWRAIREQYPHEELLSPEDIELLCGLQVQTIEKLIANGTLPCLFATDGAPRIPRHSIEKLRGETKIPAHLIVRTLGVSDEEARALIATPDFWGCKHDTTAPRCPTIHCLKTYIANNSFGDMKADAWISACEQGASLAVHPLTGSFEADELQYATSVGSLPGVRLPDGERAVFLAQDFATYRRRLKKLESRLLPDYHTETTRR